MLGRTLKGIAKEMLWVAAITAAGYAWKTITNRNAKNRAFAESNRAARLRETPDGWPHRLKREELESFPPGVHEPV